MKYFVIIFVIAAFFASCDGMYDNIEKYASEETMYPVRYDTIFFASGFERVEIDLLKAGRLPSSRMNMRASKTIIEVHGEEFPRIIDTVASWVNLTGLTQPRVYRVTVFTEDEHGNRSLPMEIEVTPYTTVDLEAIRVTEPRIIATPYSATLFWRNLNSPLMEFVDMVFEYTDVFNEIQKDSTDYNFLDMVNLAPLEISTVDVTYRIRPLFNGEPILDVLPYSQTFSLRTLSAEDYENSLTNREFRGLHWSPSKEVQITWQPLDNPTMSKTSIKYTSNVTGQEKTVEAIGGELITILPEFNLGDPFTILSTYNPAGTLMFVDVLQEAAYSSADFYPVHDDVNTGALQNCLEFFRTPWEVLFTTSRPANDGFNAGNIPQDQRLPSHLWQYGHLDGELRSFMGLPKSGQEGGGTNYRCSSARPGQANTGQFDVLPHWIVDLKEPVNFNYVRWVHKATDGAANNNPDGNASLWVHGFRIYGTNEYLGRVNNWNDLASMDQCSGTSPLPTFYRDNQTVWTPIEGEKLFPNAGNLTLMRRFPPIVEFPDNTEAYRYLKIEYTAWQVGGNNVLQVAEFFLGYKTDL